jgi:hypothetical protein
MVSNSPSDWTKFHESTYWNWWTKQDFLNQHQADIQQFYDWPDKFVPQLVKDFGYDIPRQKKMDLVLDPESHGAHTSSPFNTLGVTVAGDSVYNDPTGTLRGFWFILLSLHESINNWTGHITGGWPWANGSNIWHGGSQFPGAMDVVILNELGQTKVADLQAQMRFGDADTKLLYDLQQQYGWKIYQDLFSTLSKWQVKLSDLKEPVKSALIIFILGISANANLYPRFEQAGIKLGE